MKFQIGQTNQTKVSFVGAWMPNDSGPPREQISENVPVTDVENHPLSRLLKLESKRANTMQESLKVYRLVIFLALAVSLVSGKINVTNNIIVLHRPFGIVFQLFAWGIRSEY